MNTYKRHRFPSDIISYAVWLYYRFNLSYRDIEDQLAQRGITVSREAIRLWCIKFGAIYTPRLKLKHRGYGDTFYIDEVFAGVPDHSDQWRAAFGGCREVNLLVPLDFFGPEELTCQYPDIHLIAALDYLNTL